MSLSITKSQVMKLKRQAELAKKRATKMMDQAQDVLKVGIRTAEVGAMAFGLGVANGKYGDEKGIGDIAGVPIDLGLATALHLGGFMGVGGDLSEHMHNFGDGALAAYLMQQGVTAGVAWKNKELLEDKK